MKTKITIFVILQMVCTLINAQEITNAPSQTLSAKNVTDRVFGIGVKTMNLWNDLQQSLSVIPGNRIVLTFNASPHFRIQPEFGYYQTKENSDVLDEDLVDKNFAFSLGAYGMLKKDKTNLYVGLKYTTSKVTNEGVKVSSNPNPPFNIIYIKETETITINGFGLVFGGEYFLSSHFSVGAEAGLHSLKSTRSSSTSTRDPEKSNSFLTETNILLRFYF